MPNDFFARRLVILSLLAVSGTLVRAQDNAMPPASALRKARSLYYTPVDKGFEGFHCESSFDWKTFLEEASNQAIPENDAKLKYLQSIHLTVDDDVRSGGELHWSAAAPAPDGTEESVAKLRDGLQQVWTGFLQSWNGFITGDLVSLDPRSSVERTAEGYRVSVHNVSGLAEETFDRAMLLKQLQVTTPALVSHIEPTFQNGSQGLLVSAIRSKESQPPSSTPAEVRMEVSYAEVEHFQIPSTLRVSVGAIDFNYQLNHCTVKVQQTPR